jgi:hypothetical protein
MTTLSETFEMIKMAEYEAKLEILKEAWANDEGRCDLLNEALDLIKEAQESGKLPEMDPAQVLDYGVGMVEEHMANQSKGEDEVEEGSSLDKLAEEDVYNLAVLAGEILAENGITEADLDKLAEDEAEELGRLVAQEVAEYLADEDVDADEE